LSGFSALTSDELFSHALRVHTEEGIVRAKLLYKALLALLPDHSDALHLLGVVEYQSEQPHVAARNIQRALACDRKIAVYHSNLSLAYLDLGQVQAAFWATVRAIVLDPGHADVVINHGVACREVQIIDRAERFGQRGVWLNPLSSAAQSSFGLTLLVADRHFEAMGYLKIALIMAPADPNTLHTFGLTSTVLGRANAEYFLSLALRLRPRHRTFLIGYSAVHKFTVDDEWFAALHESEAELDHMNEVIQTQLYFTFAKAYEDVGDRQRAFDYQILGNALKRRQITYDERVPLTMFRRIPDMFTPALISEKSGLGDPDSTPIFIVGLPRSGTSLVEQILASHADVHGGGEIEVFPFMIDRMDQPGVCTFPDPVPDVTAEILVAMGRDYVAAIRKRAPTVSHITDKLPGNLPFAGMIHLALPNARIIQVRRDPIDACLSCFSKLFSTELNFTYDLGELGRFARGYQNLMDHWERVLPADRLLSLNYEDLVADQEHQTRRLLEFCQLPWDDACLSFYKTSRAVRTASVSQVRRPIYKESVGRWRPALRQLAPLLDALRGAGRAGDPT
jgi:tetratricopeptide (TPR) repeat protein